MLPITDLVPAEHLSDLKFCMHEKNIKSSMHAKFQPIRTNRKKVMGVRNFDCLKSIKTQILKLEEKLRIIITWWQPAHLEAGYSQFVSVVTYFVEF